MGCKMSPKEYIDAIRVISKNQVDHRMVEIISINTFCKNIRLI